MFSPSGYSVMWRVNLGFLAYRWPSRLITDLLSFDSSLSEPWSPITYENSDSKTSLGPATKTNNLLIVISLGQNSSLSIRHNWQSKTYALQPPRRTSLFPGEYAGFMTYSPTSKVVNFDMPVHSMTRRLANWGRLSNDWLNLLPNMISSEELQVRRSWF